jgi:FAS-associated factor 2
LQIAIARFFDGEPETDPLAEALNTPPRDARVHETLANGSGPQLTRGLRLQPAPRIVPPPNPNVNYRPGFPFNIILAPFNLATFITVRIFRILGTFLPFLPLLLTRFQSSNHNRGSRRPLLPRDTAARFIREFEEEYGQDELPFLEKGYAHALDEAKRDLRYLLVVLISPEHDDTPDYVRGTLLHPDVVSFLRNKENNTLLWGGSVQDSEAYQISTAFNVTKFPYAALIAHSPAASSGRTSCPSPSPSGMSIIAPLAGPLPASDFLARIRRAIDQHTPELTVLRAERAERDATRNIRAEQDSAYERSLAKDRERARQKREEQERLRQDAEKAALAEREAQQAAEDLAQWKTWRASRIREEPPVGDRSACRVSLRMPDGERVVRRFEGEADVEEIYAFVECYDVLQNRGGSGEKNKDTPRPESFVHRYRFHLVSPMPRTVYEVNDLGPIRSKLGRSTNLIVETIEEEDDDD